MEGGRAKGWTAWDWGLVDFAGTEWFKTMDWTNSEMTQFIKHVLQKVGFLHIYELFVLRKPPMPRENLDTEDDDNDKKAARIMRNFENETEWDPQNICEMGLEILGDSKTIINWMRGQWRATNKEYGDHVAKVQNTMSMLSAWGLDAPKNGQDLFKHIYREGNTRADELSWEARVGPERKQWYP